MISIGYYYHISLHLIKMSFFVSPIKINFQLNWHNDLSPNYFIFIEKILDLFRQVFKIIFHYCAIDIKANVNKSVNITFQVFLGLFHDQSLILQDHFWTQRHWFLCFFFLKILSVISSIESEKCNISKMFPSAESQIFFQTIVLTLLVFAPSY